jgi:hypothetical protein
MANGNGRNGKHNTEDAVAFSNIFDFEDPMLGERYTKRKEPVVSTKETRQGKSVDAIVPDQRNRGWMQGWEKARKRVATSPVSFHQDELLPMMKGIFDSAGSLEQPFRDKEGDLFGGIGVSRKGPQYGLPLDVRMSTLLGDVKRGDDIIDCYVRGLETPTRRKTYALQQPPNRSFGLGGSTRDEKAWMDRMVDAVSGRKEGPSPGASQTLPKPNYYQQDFVPQYGESGTDRADNVRGQWTKEGTPYSKDAFVGSSQSAGHKFYGSKKQPMRRSLSIDDAKERNQIYSERQNGSGSTGKRFWISRDGIKHYIN